MQWEALATIGVCLIGVLVGGFSGLSVLIWRASSELRGIKDQLKILAKIPRRVAILKRRVNNIETICKMTHPARGRSSATEATESA